MTNQILNHLLQSTAFAAMCALLTLTLRANRAEVRYGLWVAASMKFLIPFEALSGLGRALGHQLLPPAASQRFGIILEIVAQPLARTVVQPATRLPSLLGAAASTSGTALPMVLVAVWAIGSLTLVAR
jgi:hypothetical protein